MLSYLTETDQKILSKNVKWQEGISIIIYKINYKNSQRKQKYYCNETKTMV